MDNHLGRGFRQNIVRTTPCSVRDYRFITRFMSKTKERWLGISVFLAQVRLSTKENVPLSHGDPLDEGVNLLVLPES